jgi:hypothetical protein
VAFAFGNVLSGQLALGRASRYNELVSSHFATNNAYDTE